MNSKICIISAFGYYNKGDEAILHGLISQIKKQVPFAELSVVARFPERESKIDPEIRFEEQLLRVDTDHKMVKSLRIAIIAIGSLIWSHTRWKMPKFVLHAQKYRTLEAIANADLVVSCGGGFLHDSVPAYLLHLFDFYLVKSLDKRLVIIGQSIGPFRSWYSRLIAKFILNKTDYIFCREKWSLDYTTKALKLKKPIIDMIPDLAFAMQRAGGNELQSPNLNELLEVSQNQKVVGLTARQWVFPGDKPHRASIKNQIYQETLARFCDTIIERYGVKVVFFPQAITRGYESFDDRRISRAIIDMMANPEEARVLEEDFFASQLKQLIGQTYLFVGTRMHSNIFALSTFVPTIAIAYLPKTEGIMKLLGLEAYVVPIDGIDTSVLISKFEKLWENREALSDTLETRIEEILENITYKMSIIKSLLGATE